MHIFLQLLQIQFQFYKEVERNFICINHSPEKSCLKNSTASFSMKVLPVRKLFTLRSAAGKKQDARGKTPLLFIYLSIYLCHLDYAVRM